MGCTTLNSSSKSEYIGDRDNKTKACEFSTEDSLWVNEAVSAWHYTNRTITKVSSLPVFDVVFFDANCQKTSNDALIKSGEMTWMTELHHSTVQFPDGDEMPPIVTSFTSASNEEGGNTFFVMSVPSIWLEGGVKSKIGLPKFMVPVMLHEATHAIQSSTYGKQIEVLTKKYNLPESFNDDSVQKVFESNIDFANSVHDEIDLLMQAAQSSNDFEARQLAQTARDMIKARYERWMIDDFDGYREIDDVFLTMEGSGQWVGYRWLSTVNGGGLTPDEATKEFGLRGKWWSQKLGFALFMAIDRLSANWKNDAFGNGNKSVLTLLDDALLNN